MTPMQLEIYDSICNSKEVAKVVQEGEELEGKGGKMVLSCITSLKKLCNHPRLIWDAIR
jgi:DNA repair and recombination RAD54-like protein